MGVYIKGMEMPKNCAECPCRMIGYTKDHCNVLGKFIDFAVGSEGRREDCPLINLPLHGRLIDADIMIKKYEPDINRRIYGGNFIFDLEHAPTVIPADKDGET